ncbi:MAG: SCO family protein [Gammaproteobacteria bacterium]|nr:SCO family protein [Gammaproteobacteria bacterium]
MKKGFYTVLLFVLIFISANYVYLNYSKWQHKVQPVNISGTVFPKPRNVPAFNFKDGAANNFDDTKLIKKWSVLFFGYTRCPDVCPTTLTALNKMYKKLEDLPRRKRPQVIFISIDSEHDVADYPDRYSKNFNKHFIGLSGNAAQVEMLSKNLGVVSQKIPIGSIGSAEQESYIFDHSSTLYIINPKGQVQAILSAPHDPEQLARDYRAVINKYS